MLRLKSKVIEFYLFSFITPASFSYIVKTCFTTTVRPLLSAVLHYYFGVLDFSLKNRR